MLRDRTWGRKYTPDDGDLLALFYLPALAEAERYDRLTGYFNARALTLAARGLEGLVRNGGRMRLVVGCTLEADEIEAIERGERLRDLVARHLTSLPLAPPDPTSSEALELLAWMVARSHLDVKVAVPCDARKKPIPADGIFHEKAGIIEDRGGDKIAWNGSLNETKAGWQHNWESINVYTSWGPEPQRVADEEDNFARIWANQAHRVIVLDVPDAARQDLMRFMPAPASELPARLQEPAPMPSAAPGGVEQVVQEAEEATYQEPPATPPWNLRDRVWSFIERAPTLPDGGESVGEETCPVTPWPHQARAFQRLYGNWPPRLLIADEVGLGKTIQAGLLLRQAWLAGRAKRVLILAPKAVLKQWQIELREKFNLNWPIYDGGKLVWYPSPAWHGCNERAVGVDEWHREPVVIASSQLMRRQERAAVLLEDAEPWDLVVLDEAHHARRRAAGTAQEGGPNALLRLMRGLQERTEGLLLLTATPMQVHPVEVWDLLQLLALPASWSSDAFLGFFSDVAKPSPSADELDRMARLFQAVEGRYGEVDGEDARRLAKLSPLKTNKVMRALRDAANIPRRQLETPERRAAIDIMRAHTPIRRLVSRHTRELLRRYFNAGQLTTPIADREVKDRFLEMTPPERELYGAVEDYIASTYKQADAGKRSAVGFVMTIYRRRLASSFRALHNTLQNRLEAIAAGDRAAPGALVSVDDDAPDDETLDDVLDAGNVLDSDEVLDADEVEALERKALAAEESSDIRHLLKRIAELPPDSKLAGLQETLDELRRDGYRQAMVFTQYTDTMDFLRAELLHASDLKLMCFSGRGGEIPSADASWRRISRDDAKRRFRDEEAEVLLCTDAAAEGLNFQFCGAVINYDMPWNPMRVEQRIGRIDRLGQQYSNIRIVNLHYNDTVETDVYRALRDRINLFESVVGKLQPILARLPGMISAAVLSGEESDPYAPANLADEIKRQVQETEDAVFDLDAIANADLTTPPRPAPALTMDDLDRVIASPDLMPPGTEIQSLGPREYGLLAPGMRESLRVTTDPEYFAENAESVELWSPGNRLFRKPEDLPSGAEAPAARSLAELLEG